MRELQAPDAISGKKGRAYAKINNNNEELFFCKSIESSIEFAKSQVKPIGRFMVGNKVTGGEGTGSMTLYYLTPIFREMAANVVKSRGTLYFDMVIENDDNESSAKKQVVLLTGVCLDSVTLAKLDGDSDDVLEEDVDFTFDGFEILTHFTKI